MMTAISIALLLAAIAPTLMAGGRCIASFMVRRGMLGSLMLTTACMLALVIGGVIAVGRVSTATGAEVTATDRLVATIIFATPTWLVYWIGSKLLPPPKP